MSLRQELRPCPWGQKGRGEVRCETFCTGNLILPSCGNESFKSRWKIAASSQPNLHNKVSSMFASLRGNKKYVMTVTLPTCTLCLTDQFRGSTAKNSCGLNEIWISRSDCGGDGGGGGRIACETAVSPGVMSLMFFSGNFRWVFVIYRMGVRVRVMAERGTSHNCRYTADICPRWRGYDLAVAR